MDPLQALVDKEAIRSRLHLYCRSVDRCDEALFVSCFHDDAIVDHGAPTPIAPFAREAMARIDRLWTGTQHVLGQIGIELEGDAALTEAYLTAYHLTKPAPNGRRRIVIFGGRYIDRFEKRRGEWRIAHRVLVKDWHHDQPYKPAAGWNFQLQRRDRFDAVYRPAAGDHVRRG